MYSVHSTQMDIVVPVNVKKEMMLKVCGIDRCDQRGRCDEREIEAMEDGSECIYDSKLSVIISITSTVLAISILLLIVPLAKTVQFIVSLNL